MDITYEHDTLQPAVRPTLYFIGVTTGSSSIRRVFPLWAQELGLSGVQLVGIDMPLHASPDTYRNVVAFIKDDPLSLGALVTTHKIDLYNAAVDLFDVVDPLAALMSEVSCISKPNGILTAHAKDPISSGFALEDFIPRGYWRDREADVFVMGAGGSAVAISWYLTRPERGTDRPRRVVISNRSQQRLASLRRVHDELKSDVPLELVHTPNPQDNDAVLQNLPEGSVIINATGLGKDMPGSPLTDRARFPENAIVWDLNYRGDLVFLAQARSADAQLNVTVVDGWVYFLHGWTQVIAEVFGIEIPASGPSFDRLSELALSGKSESGTSMATAGL
ncbi:shikimate dehydrogenase family protein [Arthrobacter sp. MA-N2]|uniref:shikimate dehydrogenase family protein n=1 Tax=Arthrobacter sp. MA-N2 TaxID=1101188 RepID=UPI0004BB6AF9|nr:shikimate dehydrogenase [Arthrobacter sp. MA-N2]